MKTLSLFIMAVCCTAAVVQAEPVAVSGPITSVIVYRGQALVTRTLEIPQAGGEIELLIENLPEKILPESLYAQSDGSVSVLSVRYREQIIREDTRQEVVTLEQQIQAVRRQIQNAQFNIENAGDRINLFRQQWQLNVDAARADLNRGILQPEAVEKLTTYLESKSVQLHKEIVGLTNEKQDLEKQLAELEKKLSDLQQGRQHVNRQALVYIAAEKKTKDFISLSYLVRDAHWQPQYNLRAMPDRNTTAVEYNALVHQSSGEDWTNTSLALSTAEPTMVSAPPTLSPMQVTLGQGGRYGYGNDKPQIGMPQATVAGEKGEMKVEFADQSQHYDALAKNRRQTIARGVQAQRELNQIAISNQMIELEADRRMLMELKERSVAIRQTEGVSVLYALKGKLTLPSRSEQQMLTIASYDCAAQFVFVASPLLTDYVYLQADIVNAADTILLPGPASMFRNGEFVGRSDMKLVTSGQTFVASFGIDSQIQVVREFTDTKSDSLLGSRTSEHTYRFALSNYKAVPVSLRLLDRIPWTDNAALAIELKQTSHPLCEDAEYVRTEKRKGILRWDLQLAPQTTGEKATIVTYAYAMKYDKSLSVVPAGPK